jgi:SAM-dependent methyltransferase
LIIDNPLNEPLALSGSFTLEISKLACAPQASGHGCAPYHGFWPFLRMMGMGKTLSGFSGEFSAAIRSAVQIRQPAQSQVLISGCADYSAYAHVWHACHDLAQPPAVTALDLCETPLALSRWYARQRASTLETVCMNVLDYAPGPVFDLIITSSFLSYFSPGQRRELFRAYAGMLKPGGEFVFTTRLRSGPEDQTVGFSQAQCEDFVARTRTALPRLEASMIFSDQEAVQMATEYARHLSAYPVNSEATLQTLAADAGLEWVSCLKRHTQAAQPGVTGPTVGEADYLFVTLRKPD